MTATVDWAPVKKSYESCRVLDIDKLMLGEGEILVVAGANGAGKSTLIRLLALVESADEGSGEYKLFGEPVNEGNRLALRRRLAVVWQEPYMFRRSVYENIAMGLKWRKLPDGVIAKRVKAVADLLEIEDLSQRAEKLSRGWAQRVALARALALEPDLILLDEPLSALDRQIRARLLAGLKPLLSANGRSTVYVTHSATEAAGLGTRRLLLAQGRRA
ncbi:MAG: ATP-binding cassette domain-containing protein [Actinomycetota bacterium]|nr:ATP-binding cassette domain-containing protein [Actinomycetota bacterium]